MLASCGKRLKNRDHGRKKIFARAFLAHLLVLATGKAPNAKRLHSVAKPEAPSFD
jgi:hypothetical protein